MGKKDLWQSDYFDDNVRFANLYNGALFGGRTIIKPEELEAHDKTDFSNFKTENKLLFEVLSNSNNKEKIEQIFREEAEKYFLDKDTATALLGIAGMKMDLDQLKIEKNGKVEYKMSKMCKAFEELKNDARNEGYESGISEGYESGINEGYKCSIKALMETMNFILEQALDALKITDTDRTKFYS